MRVLVAMLLTTIFLISAKPPEKVVENGELAVEFTSTEEVFAMVGKVDVNMQQRFSRKVMTSYLPMMIVYIESPGGSVWALTRMLEVMEASDMSFICIARYAASAAFMFLQHCDFRMVLPSGGILMSHNAQVGLRGDIATVEGILSMWKDILRPIENRVAKRLKITYRRYKRLVANSLFMSSKKAVRMNAVDFVIKKVTCSAGLVEQTVVRESKRCGIFGCSTTKYEFSACPLLTKPIRRVKDE